MWTEKLLAGLSLVAMLALAGCEETKVTEQTQVKDKLLGGKEVTKTQVIEQGDKTQVRETETEINNDGQVTEKKTEVKGDKID